MPGIDVVTILERTSVFQGLTRADLQIFRDACQRRTCQEKEVIIQEGRYSNTLYIILAGQFQVFLPQHIRGSNARRFTDVKLNTLTVGDYFGEYSLIDGKPASATVIALRAGELLQIPQAHFDAIVTQNDRIGKIIYRNLLQLLITRMRQKEQEYDLLLTVG